MTPINENILSSDINRSFDEMKRHVVDIDEKDVDKIHSFVEKYLTPKEYEKKAFGEVFTPLSLVREMLEAIPKYADVDFWKNPKSKILDPAAGIGNFPLIAYELLMDGLKRVIPDASKRKRHILENMLYMVELNPNNVRLMRKIFGGKNYKLNIIRGDFLKDETQERMKKEWGVEKYDLVMGNPPFNTEFTEKGASPLYHFFIEMMIDRCKYMTFLTPSKWFSGGKGLSLFRNFMLQRNDIVVLQQIDDASKVFSQKVDIKGGINYFIKSSSHSGKCIFNGIAIDLSKYDVLVKPKYIDLLDKIIKQTKERLITSRYCSSSYYGIETNDKRLQSVNIDESYTCFVSSKKDKNRTMYVAKNSLTIPKEKRHWKVVTPRTSGEGFDGFGKIFIADPNTVYTSSYIGFKVKNKQEAISLKSYLECKLPNYLLSIRKISHFIDERTCMWIPYVPLDKLWNNDMVKEHFSLTPNNVRKISNVGF
jgi:site-specific DNA-methyltransferase (adenine-specific)